MNPDQILAHLKRLTTTLTPRQLASLVGVFVAVVAVVGGSAYWVSAPTYTLLYSDLDAESAGAVVTRLKAAKIPYQIEEGSRAIRVPADRVDELRLDMASQGLPTSGRIGFEVFDRTAFGTTEFLEHVNYRRGLEGELARTIGTLAEVSSARVHIALAKESLFVSDAQEAKASVVLKLRNNKPLAASTVNGIAGLVAASVESLRPEAVVIVDTFGRPLSQAKGEEDEATGASLERQQRIERELATRVVALLEPVVGPGHVRVNVSARLDIQSQEETEERWDPTTVVRSRQASSDGAASTAAGGIAGARANAPPTASTAPPAAPAPVLSVAAPGARTTETTNYEVSKLTRHTIVPQGQLSRLSVAVILDDERATTRAASGEAQVTSKPRSAEDIERIQHLVAAAVGLDPERGDQLTVENISFGDQAPLPEDEPIGPTWMEIPRQVAPYAPQIIRVVSVLTIALLAVVMVLRPMMRAAFPAPRLQAVAADGTVGPSARTVAEMEGAIEAELDAALGPIGEGRRLPVLAKRIARRAEEKPEELARLVRTWLAEEDR
ncbi:MAG TPA: flagellar basal-body MS-ring/collar protein FliF [Vicinamibacterales bacterium]|nr:flagellar basal-body MS-ring/collar protein FliF [Vicinamibacterales bacterium]